MLKWFLENKPEELDLFGQGWDYNFFELEFFGEFLQRFNRKFLKIKSKTYSKIYKGSIDSKINTLGSYKFNVCFENSKSDNGYITEKIMDSFNFGCVPVYLGCSNLSDYIPIGTFIDYRLFNSPEELYGFLKGISDKEYLNYQEKIYNFLNSTKSKIFSAEYFGELISNSIVNNYEK